MSTFANVEEVHIPRRFLESGHEFLRKVGSTRREGMVLWAGIAEGNSFDVTELLIPNQHSLITPDGVCVVVDAAEMHRLNVHLFKSRLRIIAQIHSHPSEAYHSSTDDEYAIATTIGSFSLVVPDFAKREFSFAETAIYRLISNGEWKGLTDAQIRLTFNVSEN